MLLVTTMMMMLMLVNEKVVWYAVLCSAAGSNNRQVSVQLPKAQTKPKLRGGGDSDQSSVDEPLATTG